MSAVEGWSLIVPLHRNSLPSTGLKFGTSTERSAMASMGLGQINTTKFLFGEDEAERHGGKTNPNSTTSPKVKSYLQMNATDENFPILVRHEEYPNMVSYDDSHRSFRRAQLLTGAQLSASSAALDLALSQSPGPESQSNGWPSFSRHRPQYSLPLNALSLQQNNVQGAASQRNNGSQADTTPNKSPVSASRINRLSRELDFHPYPETNQQPSLTSSAGALAASTEMTPPKLSGSYSTNDIPTMKNTVGMGNATNTANPRAQQHFHNHNASLGRIPANAVSNRQSREFAGGEMAISAREAMLQAQDKGQGLAQAQGPGHGPGQATSFQPFQSALHANAPAFGPPLASTAASAAPTANNAANAQASGPYPPVGYYGPYGGNMAHLGNMHMTMGMGVGMGMPNLPQLHGMVTNEHYYPPPYPYPAYGYGARGYQPQARALPVKRTPDGDCELSHRTFAESRKKLTARQPIASPTYSSRACAGKSTGCARISMDVVIFRRSWRSATRSISRLSFWRRTSTWWNS